MTFTPTAPSPARRGIIWPGPRPWSEAPSRGCSRCSTSGR